MGTQDKNQKAVPLSSGGDVTSGSGNFSLKAGQINTAQYEARVEVAVVRCH